MSDLLLINRPFSKEKSNLVASSDSISSDDGSYLVWKTCLRQIFFFDKNDAPDFQIQKGDEVFSGHDAESFLAEVLCGLKSPLIGETEVFGQFKLWWKNLPEDNFIRAKFQSRIETLYALVKSVREKVLCGHGSQSYGSLLRRHLKENSWVDIIGAGHLVQEIAPWIENKSSFRIWCRDPEKVAKLEWVQNSSHILSLQEAHALEAVVVVAAPLKHDELNEWLKERGFSKHNTLFDLRADSAEFVPFAQPETHLRLCDFSSQHEEHRFEIEKKAQSAKSMIVQWRDQQEAKMQVRPYGWDDL